MLKPKIPEPGFWPSGQVMTDAHLYRWVVAMVWSGSHRRVARDLRDKGFVPWAPMGSRFSLRTVGRSSGLERRVRCVQTYPVFGSYIFVGHESVFLGKSSHEKVVAVLGDESGPILIPSTAISALARAECDGEWDKTSIGERASQFSIGQTVRIKTGPFAEFYGIVTGIRGEARYQIETACFGRPTKSTLEAGSIEKVF